MALEAGKRLGPYEILALLGAGGMGQVYKAHDTKLGRDVAIKVLPQAFARDKDRLARFEREARLLASLNHPNIATLFDLQEHEGTHFLVLELVPGETLAERIEHGRMPLDEILPLFKQIAEALEAAHEKGIIHRDLKPPNIKVTPEGKAKVLDFGLAKALAGESPVQELSESPTLTRQATETGVLLGTAPYMSPEQARGKAVDKRADIWAFGCCLYEALTGKTAFLGETISDTLVAVLEREPDWEVLPRKTPAIVRSLLRRCLQKDAQGRLHDMADARIEIDEAIVEPSLPSEVPIRVSKVPRWQGVLPWLVTAIVGAIAIWSYLPEPSPGLGFPVRFSLPAPPPSMETHASSIAISPDGMRMVYVAEQEGNRQLYLRDMDENEAYPIAGTENALVPFFSPNGQWIGFHADGKLKKVSPTGGPPLLVCDVSSQMWGACWGPDDSILFNYFGEGYGGGVWQVSAAGGRPELLIRPRPEQGEWAIAYPEVLPGGKEVLFNAMDGSCNTLRIEVQSLETGERRTLIEGGDHARYAPSGHLVYAEAGSILAAPFDLAGLELTGAPIPVVDGVAFTGCGDAHFALSSKGILVYAPGGEQRAERTLVWMDRKGNAQPITVINRRFRGPKLSPIGDRIATYIAGGNSQVWIYEMERGILTPLTSEGQNFWPTWSPDGTHVAFPSMRSGAVANLFLKPADGSGSAERLTTSEYAQNPWSWSPDGNLLVFQQGLDPETGWDIYVLTLQGDRKPEPFLNTRSNELQPALSPDGRWMAYVSNESGSNEIYVTPFPGPGGKWRISTDGGREPVWASSGAELFYREVWRMMVVEIVTQPEFRPGIPRVLFDGPPDALTPYGRNYDVTPDGERFLMSMPSEQDAVPQLHVVLNWFEELKRLVPAN